jgi:hypothetical protein
LREEWELVFDVDEREEKERDISQDGGWEMDI